MELRAPSALAFGLVLLAGGAAAQEPGAALARLADRFAAELARAARGRALELAVPEDRTGRGDGVGRDLQALTLARLAPNRATGGRLLVRSTLAETGGRLVVSARLVEEGTDRLVDLVSVSVESGPQRLDLTPLPTTAAPMAADVLTLARTTALDEAVLDLAWLGDDRVATLSAEALAVYRWDGASLLPEARRSLPGPLATVRAPGGVIVPARDGFWVLNSRMARAALFALEGSRIVEMSEAEALPCPACGAGLRFIPGTNLLQAGTAEARLLAVEQELTIDAEGRLRAAGGSALDRPVGSASATLWPGLALASSASAPGEGDALLLVTLDGDRPTVSGEVPVEGSVRALAARTAGSRARVLAAVEDRRGTHLLWLELGRREP